FVCLDSLAIGLPAWPRCFPASFCLLRRMDIASSVRCALAVYSHDITYISGNVLYAVIILHDDE
ncbi:MAG: hypothetical protein AAFO01_21365, partial [Pseudomonadota bacterium]